MLKRGIRVAAAGDNCRDSFYAYGDHDVVDTFRQAVRILHLDHPLSAAPALVGATPSLIGAFAGHGRLAVGAPARLIVFNARTINEIVSRPQIRPRRHPRGRENFGASAGLFRALGSRYARGASHRVSLAEMALESMTKPKHWRTL